jgi:hypothetical protein
MDPNAWLQPPSLEVVIAKVRKIINNGILVDIWVGPDDRNSNEYILQVALIQECLELIECLVREDEEKCRIHKMDCIGFFMSSVNQNRGVPRPIQNGVADSDAVMHKSRQNYMGPQEIFPSCKDDI